MNLNHPIGKDLVDEAEKLNPIINSLKDEVLSFNTYNERIIAVEDEELKEILSEYRQENIENIIITLELLRRKMPNLDKYLKKYLFTDTNLLNLKNKDESNNNDYNDIGIGDLK